MREIYFNGGPCYLMETPYEINTGMGMFANEYLATGCLPDHGLLFHLANNYNTFTMEGVPFPIVAIFYDQEWNILSSISAYPHMSNISMPYNTYWMYEHA